MFHALGDGSRRAMVERLAAGIVASTKVGRVRTYQLVTEALTPAAEWISRQRLPAERRLDRLGNVLAQTDLSQTDKE
jgi:hypothetical protein